MVLRSVLLERLAMLVSRFRLGWARSSDRRTKERLRRTVVTKHLEKAKREGISLADVPFDADDAHARPEQFAIKKNVAAPARSMAATAAPPARKKSPSSPQQRLPLTVVGYSYPPGVAP